MRKIIARNKRATAYVLIGTMCAIAITLLLLPADYFDEGQSMCLSVVLFDTSCYGCGMTRAIQHLIHLEIATAWSYNKLAFIVMPLFGVLIIREIRKLLLADKP